MDKELPVKQMLGNAIVYTCGAAIYELDRGSAVSVESL